MQKTGSPCSCLAFGLRRHSEFLVGMADRSLKCFDAGLYLFSGIKTTKSMSGSDFHFCDPWPYTILCCETTNVGLVHCLVCLFMHQLLLILILPVCEVMARLS